jgi:hypothetical protein
MEAMSDVAQFTHPVAAEPRVSPRIEAAAEKKSRSDPSLKRKERIFIPEVFSNSCKVRRSYVF